jgi:hypothetical protein
LSSLTVLRAAALDSSSSLFARSASALLAMMVVGSCQQFFSLFQINFTLWVY